MTLSVKWCTEVVLGINIFNWDIFKVPVKPKLTTLSTIECVCIKLLGEPSPPFSENTTREDFLMDSLDDMELLLALEDEFDIDLPLIKYEECVTVSDLYQLIEERLNDD